MSNEQVKQVQTPLFADTEPMLYETERYGELPLRKARQGSDVLCQVRVNEQWRTFAVFSDFDDFATTRTRDAMRQAQRDINAVVRRVLNL
jgi:hypothetical protein